MKDKSGIIGDFLEEAIDYLNRKSQNTPVLTTDSIAVYFDDPLLEEICKHKQDYKKYFNSIITHGYVRASKGGRNGIVNVRETDKNLTQRTHDFLASSRGQDILKQYQIDPENIQPVKVVAHKPSGERLIGIKDISSGKVVIFDKTTYKK